MVLVMYLNMMMVEAGEDAVFPEGFVFRWTTHHVKEIYIELLPQKFYLDGSSKLTITCGKCDFGSNYRQRLGTSQYCVEDFDFRDYCNSSPHLREITILRVIEQALCDIANLHGGDISIIKQTADQVRMHNFTLTKCIPKLSKKYGDIKLDIYRNLSKDYGETWSLEVVLNKTKQIIHRETIGKTPQYLDLRDFYKRSTIDGNCFIIYSRLGKEVYRYKIEE